MSQFPDLRPSSRTFEHATWPVSSFVSVSGKETRVLLGDKPNSHSVSLQFRNISSATAEKVFAHWRGQNGLLNSFVLPASVWSGWADYNTSVPLSTEWRYAAPPTANSVAPDRMDVSVRFVSLS